MWALTIDTATIATRDQLWIRYSTPEGRLILSPKTHDENFSLGVDVSAVLEYGPHARPSEGRKSVL